MLKYAIVAAVVATPALSHEPKVKDHYKTTSVSVPYYVEECKKGGDIGDAVGGFIIGAIIGEAAGASKEERNTLGGLGAIIGLSEGNKTTCKTVKKHRKEQRQIYSHSTISFYHEGKWYNVEFKK